MIRLPCLILVLLCSWGCTPDPWPAVEREREALPQGELAWMRQFGGSGYDQFRDMVVLEDGYAFLGSTDSRDGLLADRSRDGNDYWLVRTDREGKLLWQRTYGGSGDDQGQALVATADGGFAMVGYAMSSDGDATANQGFHDNWILKTDASGHLEWQQSFGYSGHDHAYDLVQTEDGGYIFAGFLDVTASGGEGSTAKGRNRSAHGVGEFWITRLDAQGALVWRRYFGGSNNDRAHALTLTGDGGVLVTGFTESMDFDISESQGSYDYWALKLSADGELTWEQTYGGSGIDIAHTVCRDKQGGFVIAGQSFSSDGPLSSSQGGGDLWLVGIDKEGELQWEQRFGGAGFDIGYTLQATPGGFVLGGSSGAADPDGTGANGDLWVLRTDTRGQLLWEARQAGPGLDAIYALEVLPDGSIVAAGALSSSAGEDAADAVVLNFGAGSRTREK